MNLRKSKNDILVNIPFKEKNPNINNIFSCCSFSLNVILKELGLSSVLSGTFYISECSDISLAFMYYYFLLLFQHICHHRFICDELVSADTSVGFCVIAQQLLLVFAFVWRKLSNLKTNLSTLPSVHCNDPQSICIE